MTINCLQCNKELKEKQTRPWMLKQGRGKYCSRSCQIKTLDNSGKNHWNYQDGRAVDKPAYNKRDRQENPERYRYYAMTRRVREFNAEGSHTSKEWMNLKKKYNYMCLCCKKFEPEIILKADHIVPLTMGGTNWIENIQPLCGPCNSRKNVKTIDYSLINCSPFCNELVENIR